MSIKIFNGFIIPGETLESFQALLPVRRTKFREDLMLKVHQDIANCFIHTSDISSIFKPERDGKVALDVLQETLRQDVIDSTIVMRRTAFDIEADLMIKPSEQGLLVLYFGPNSFEESVKSIFGLLDYSYWNNTDEPETLSSEDWERRRCVWQNALNDWSSPVDAGFLRASLANANEILTVAYDFREELIPGLDARIQNCIKSIRRAILTDALDSIPGLSFDALRTLEQKGKVWFDDNAKLNGLPLNQALNEHLRLKLPVSSDENNGSFRFNLCIVDHSTTREKIHTLVIALSEHLKESLALVKQG